MGAEARLFLIPEPASFRPDPAALARLVAALRRSRWVADPAEPWFSRMTFGAARTHAHAAPTGAFVRRLGPPGAPGSYEALPAGDLEPFFAGIAREERQIVWPVERLGETPLRHPLNVPSPVGREDTYYALGLWLAEDYVYVTSEGIDPFDDEGCGACGAPLAREVEDQERSLFHAARLARACPRCGAPFEASSRDATVRDPYTGDEQLVPGGAAFRFALVVDCGKCFPERTFGAQPELQALCEMELAKPFRSVLDAY